MKKKIRDLNSNEDKYKIWYDPIENKYWLKFDSDKDKIEITKTQFDTIVEEINDEIKAKSCGATICYEQLARRIRRNYYDRK